MADKPKDEAKRVPGLEPGTQPRDPVDERYASPPLSAPDHVRTAGYGASDTLELLKRIERLEGKDPDAREAQSIEDQRRRDDERAERRAREADERRRNMATYRAMGRPGEPAGEIPAEQPGQGRRLVYTGETFRFAGQPGRWMEPLDDLAKRRIKDEAERQEAIARVARENRIEKGILKSAQEAFDASARAREQFAARADEHRSGAGG